MQLKTRKEDARWNICKACKFIHEDNQWDEITKKAVEEHLMYLHKKIQSMEIQMGLRVINDYDLSKW